MSEKNEKEEAREYIKQLADFDINGNYYDEEGKNEISKVFKKLLFVDDQSVRKFLEKFFVDIKTISKEYDLLGTEEDIEKDEPEEETSEEEEETEEKPEDKEGEEKEEETEDETEDETTQKVPVVPEGYMNRANDLVEDMGY